MIDEDFVMKLVELDAKGKDGLAEARELLKTCGGMKRLLAIAVRGLGKKPKAAGQVQTGLRTRIPDEFPSETEKQKAIIYWERKRRPDLVTRVEDEAAKFHAHHLAAGTRSLSWPATWQTWYSNALEFNRPPRETGLFAAEVAFEQTNIPGWVGRLRVFYESDSPVWPDRWGGKPGKLPSDPIPSGCRCPAQAFALYLEEVKKRGGGHGTAYA